MKGLSDEPWNASAGADILGVAAVASEQQIALLDEETLRGFEIDRCVADVVRSQREWAHRADPEDRDPGWLRCRAGHENAVSQRDEHVSETLGRPLSLERRGKNCRASPVLVGLGGGVVGLRSIEPL